MLDYLASVINEDILEKVASLSPENQIKANLKSLG